jgi:zinc protease
LPWNRIQLFKARWEFWHGLCIVILTDYLRLRTARVPGCRGFIQPAARNCYTSSDQLRRTYFGEDVMFKRMLGRIVLLICAGLLPGVGMPGSVADQDVVRSRLENGLQVVIVRNPIAPVVTTQINYLAGSNEAPPGFPGMPHAQEHMMFRGSPSLSAAQLSYIAAAMGGDFDADTQQTVTQYFFTVPAEYLDVALHIESIRMQGVLDNQESWEKERGAIDQEVSRDLSNPEYLFYTQLIEHMFEGTPYAHDALGTRPSFAETTGTMLQEFHKTWYVPNNAVLVVVGDVDPGQALKEIRQLFQPIPSRPLPQRPDISFKPPTAAKLKLETDLPYGLTAVAYRFPGYDSPDYAAGQILADVLNSQRGALYTLVTEGKALDSDFESNCFPEGGVSYALAAIPQGADGAAMSRTLKGIIAQYVRDGFPEELVEAAKRREVMEAEFEKNSISGLAAAWSQALAVEGRTSPEDDIRAAERVTAADVNRVARQYLVNETATVAVLTPRRSGAPTASKGFGGRESFAPRRTETTEVPDWARKIEAAPSVPPWLLKPTVTNLPNGLRLVVQPESVSPTVTVLGKVKSNADLQSPPGKDGVAPILDGLFDYGTTTLDRLAFQRALDDIGADESAGASFSLQVLSRDFERGMELLASNMLQPALPASAFKVERQETISAVRGQLQSPGYLSDRALLKGLFPAGDPALRQVTPKTLESVSLEDVKDYFRKVFRPDMTTIVVIGQVSPDRAREVVERYFGQWRASGPKPRTEPPRVPPNSPSSASVPDSTRVQADVTLAETLGLTRLDPGYYAIEVGNHVLSGAFYATRLYHDLREEAGLVYTIESMLDAGKTRSVFSVYYACDPPNVARARTLVERDLREMQTSPVSPTELRQAKTLLIRRIPLSQSSLDDIAQQMLDLSLKDLPLDEPVRAARRYLETDAAEVQAAFKTWIRPDGFVEVTLGPLSK